MTRQELNNLPADANLYVIIQAKDSYFIKQCTKDKLSIKKQYITVLHGHIVFEVFGYETDYNKAKRLCDFYNK